MAPYAYSITKRFTFRGAVEEFSNVYHYDHPPAFTDFDGAVDDLVEAEKLIHAPAVTFVRARAWGPTDQGPAASTTRLMRDLTGTGQLVASGGNIYKELAVVISWYVGRAPLSGRKRFLRKYIHCSARPSSSATSGGDDVLTATDLAPFVTFASSIKTLNVNQVNLDICTPQGDHLPLNTTAAILNRMHIRQLHQ